MPQIRRKGSYSIMTIEQLRKDMIAAAKAGDKDRKAVLSALVSADERQHF